MTIGPQGGITTRIPGRVGIEIQVMMTIKNKILFGFIFTLVVFLSGCATGYHRAERAFTGGYTDLKVGPSMYRISFEGNAYITGERAYQYTLYRAAEIAKENNCNWFEIIGKDEASRKEWGGFLGYVEKPRNAIVIKLIQALPSNDAYAADDVLESLHDIK